MRQKALKLGFLLMGLGAMPLPSSANDFLIASCEGALKVVREQLTQIYLTNARKNATPPDKIGGSISGSVAFGLGSPDAESSSARDTLARLNGLETYLKKQASKPGSDQDLHIVIAEGQDSIEAALKELDNSAAAFRYEDWSDSTDEASPGVGNGSLSGIRIPARLGRLAIPRQFLAKMFGVWIFPGPIGYSMLGVPGYLRSFLSQASVEGFMTSHLSLHALTLYHQWIVPNATQVSITAGILLASLYRTAGFKKPRFVTALENGLRRLNPFAGASADSEDADVEEEDKELRPLASQFESFMESYRRSLKNPPQNAAFNPHYFATSYFDRETFEREVAASDGDLSLDEMDESEANRKMDMMFFYKNGTTPVLMLVDRKD